MSRETDADEVFGPGAASGLTREERLEATLESIWSNACEDCGRPYHPRAASCYGCELDRERAARSTP